MMIIVKRYRLRLKTDQFINISMFLNMYFLA